LSTQSSKTKKEGIGMEIIKIGVDEIKPAPYNPREEQKPGDPVYEKVKQSIETFDLVEPLVWNRRSCNLVGGHLRLKVLIEKGVKEVDVSVVDLSPVKEKMLNIALNKIQNRFDDEKLSMVITEIEQCPEFDISQTGFDMPELSEILDRLVTPKEDEFDSEAAVSLMQESVTKRGDLICLGEHRVLCGDSSNPDDVKRLMGDEKAAMLNTDYPYNVSYMQKDNRPSADTRPKKSRKWDAIYSDNMPQDEYEAWMRKVLVNITDHLKPGGPIYIWQGHRQIPPLYQALLDLGFHISSIICWMKESPTISYADYSFQNEHALYGWLEGAPHYWAGKPGEGNVWQVKRDPTKTYQHPTTKPIVLAHKAIQNSSKIGDIVIDTFLGAGFSILGAESLKRRCYGLEIDPRYCDVIVKRYIAYVGADKVSEDIRKKYLKEE
jgi:DNA modification methylase